MKYHFTIYFPTSTISSLMKLLCSALFGRALNALFLCVEINPLAWRKRSLFRDGIRASLAAVNYANKLNSSLPGFACADMLIQPFQSSSDKFWRVFLAQFICYMQIISVLQRNRLTQLYLLNQNALFKFKYFTSVPVLNFKWNYFGNFFNDPVIRCML